MSCFSNARITILPRNRGNGSLSFVTFVVTHRIWWKPAQINSCALPKSIYDYKGCDSLELVRLPSDSAWETVEETVRNEDRQGYGIVVPGKLHGPSRRKRLSGDVQVIIYLDRPNERDGLLNELRVRIAPWQLLQGRARHLASSVEESFSVEEIREKLQTVLVRDKDGGNAYASIFNNTSKVEKEHSTGAKYAATQMEKYSWVEKLNSQIIGLANIILTAVKVGADNVKSVAETADNVSTYLKLIPGGVGSAFQLALIGARLAAACAEADRGRRELPGLLTKVMELLHSVTESVALVLHPSVKLQESEQILESNVFEVLVDTFDLMGIIEGQLMQSGFGQLMNAHVVSQVELELKELKRSVVDVVLFKRMAKLEQHADEVGSDSFKSYFDKPLLPPNVVFDFVSTDADGKLVSPEGRLLDSVLCNGKSQDSRGSIAYGTHGMGGVGKTTALKGICHEKAVWEMYPDGICFLEFGEKASNRKVIDELVRCLRNFGSSRLASEMKNTVEIGKVVETVAQWLNERAVLFVCDDLWPLPNNELGYVPELKKLLRDTPKSALLVSTRDRKIARAVGNSPVPFKSLEPLGLKAREILSTASFGKDWKYVPENWGCANEFERILHVCAGLPLLLSIAGSSISIDYEDSEDVSFSVAAYWERLQDSTLAHLQEEHNPDYHHGGLEHVVEASLKVCCSWGRNGGWNYDIRQLFISLCVLDKQLSIPESTLMIFWGMRNRSVSEIVRKLADLNIVTRTLSDRHKAAKGKKAEYCVRLHDLILDLCKHMAGDDVSSWHSHLIRSYSATISVSNFEESICPWWDLKDSYMSENLSRHLTCGGYNSVLRDLLCDVRWTVQRMRHTDLITLETDFDRLSSTRVRDVSYKIHLLRWVLVQSWIGASGNQHLFPFHVFGLLSNQDRQHNCIASYLASVEEYFPRTWLKPMTKCLGPKDSRELPPITCKHLIRDVCVSWSLSMLFIATNEIRVRTLTRQEELFVIPYEAASIRVSESVDGIIVALGIHFKEVCWWDASTGVKAGRWATRSWSWFECVAVSPDGKTIATGSSDGSLQRWDSSTGARVGTPMHGHKGSVRVLAISRDNKLIVSGSADKSVRRWDLQTGLAIGEPMLGHSSYVLSVSISGNGELIVSGSSDNTILRWNALTGNAIGKPIFGHTAPISSVSVTDDTSVIASCSGDKSVRLWDGDTGHLRGNPFLAHSDWVRFVMISPDGGRIISAGDDKKVIQWEVSGNVQVSELVSNHEEEVIELAANVDGKLVVSLSLDGKMQCWDGLSRKPIGDLIQVNMRPMRPFSEGSLAISDDGKIIAHGERLERWNTMNGEKLDSPLNWEAEVRFSKIYGNKKLILVGLNSGILQARNRFTGEIVSEMVGHCTAVKRMSLNGCLVTALAEDHWVRRWDIRSGRRVRSPYKLEVNKSILAVSPDGSIFITSAGVGVMQRWDSATKQMIGEPIVAAANNRSICDVVFNGGGTVIVTRSRDYSVRSWNAITGEAAGKTIAISYVDWANTFSAVGVSWDGQIIVTGSQNGDVQLWDTKSGEKLSELPTLHNDKVESAAISRDGCVVVAGSEDGTIQRWDARSGMQLGSPVRKHQQSVVSLAVNDDGSRILAGHSYRSISRWEAVTSSTCELRLKEEGPVDALRHFGCLAINGQGNIVVTSSDSDEIQRWDWLSGQEIDKPMLGHENSICMLAVSSDGKRIISSSEDMFVVNWVLSNGSIIGEENELEPLNHLVSTEIQSEAVTGFQLDKHILPREAKIFVNVADDQIVVGLTNGCVVFCKLHSTDAAGKFKSTDDNGSGADDETNSLCIQ